MQSWAIFDTAGMMDAELPECIVCGAKILDWGYTNGNDFACQRHKSPLTSRSRTHLVNLEETQPTVTLKTDVAIHVLPMWLIRGWICGKEPLPIENLDILRTIISEWLKGVE